MHETGFLTEAVWQEANISYTKVEQMVHKYIEHQKNTVPPQPMRVGRDNMGACEVYVEKLASFASKHSHQVEFGHVLIGTTSIDLFTTPVHEWLNILRTRAVYQPMHAVYELLCTFAHNNTDFLCGWNKDNTSIVTRTETQMHSFFNTIISTIYTSPMYTMEQLFSAFANMPTPAANIPHVTNMEIYITKMIYMLQTHLPENIKYPSASQNMKDDGQVFAHLQEFPFMSQSPWHIILGLIFKLCIFYHEYLQDRFFAICFAPNTMHYFIQVGKAMYYMCTAMSTTMLQFGTVTEDIKQTILEFLNADTAGCTIKQDIAIVRPTTYMVSLHPNICNLKAGDEVISLPIMMYKIFESTLVFHNKLSYAGVLETAHGTFMKAEKCKYIPWYDVCAFLLSNYMPLIGCNSNTLQDPSVEELTTVKQKLLHIAGYIFFFDSPNIAHDMWPADINITLLELFDEQLKYAASIYTDTNNGKTTIKEPGHGKVVFILSPDIIGEHVTNTGKYGDGIWDTSALVRMTRIGNSFKLRAAHLQHLGMTARAYVFLHKCNHSMPVLLWAVQQSLMMYGQKEYIKQLLKENYKLVLEFYFNKDNIYFTGVDKEYQYMYYVNHILSLCIQEIENGEKEMKQLYTQL